MCFYNLEQYLCLDTKWTDFKSHCNKEYRFGETCGMKLVYQKINVPRKCSRCTAVDIKLRKREKLVDQISRWQREGRCPASVEKATSDIAALDEQIKGMYEETAMRRNNIVNTSHFARWYPEIVMSGSAGDGSWHESRSLKKPDVVENETNIDEAMGTELDFDGTKGGQIASPETEYSSMKPAKKFDRDDCTSLGLPITFESLESPATVMACADTGADFNAISKDLAYLLRLSIKFDKSRLVMDIKLPNGKFIKPCGYITTTCTFGVESHLATQKMPCELLVFHNLVRPGLLMGRQFLNDTETMLANLHRLIRIPSFDFQMPCIRSITTSSQVLVCCINGKAARAVADTGSERDFMSHSFALSQQHNVEACRSWFRYADDSLGEICGLVKAELVIGADKPTFECAVDKSFDTNIPTQDDGLEPAVNEDMVDEDCRRVVDTVFYVVRGLEKDVFIGGHSLAVLQPFRFNQNDFEPAEIMDDGVKNFGRIIEIGITSKVLNKGKEVVGRLFASASGSDQNRNLEGNLLFSSPMRTLRELTTGRR